jgi:copper chaperone CopZ
MHYRAGFGIAIVGLCLGCSGGKTSSLEATPVAFNIGGAPTVEFNVPDMMCPTSCVAKTREILSQQPGAKEVLVDFDKKTAIVAIEAGQFDSSQAIAALVDHGFDHSTVKSDAAASSETSGAPVEQPAISDHSG